MKKHTAKSYDLADSVGFRDIRPGTGRAISHTVSVRGRFVTHPERGDEAQIEVCVGDNFKTQSRHSAASLLLSPDQSRALALAIAPPDVTRAHNLFPDLVTALQDLADVFDSGNGAIREFRFIELANKYTDSPTGITMAELQRKVLATARKALDEAAVS